VSTWSEKRTLQTCVALAGLVAVWAGAWGVLHGLGGHGGGSANHERYLSGLLLAIGLAFWTTVSDIERNTARFRLLTALVVVGGFSRLLGVALGDTVSWSIGGALAMELLVAPLLCLWQGRVGPPPCRPACGGRPERGFALLRFGLPAPLAHGQDAAAATSFDEMRRRLALISRSTTSISSATTSPGMASPSASSSFMSTHTA
jgi:hypothetical protein